MYDFWYILEIIFLGNNIIIYVKLSSSQATGMLTLLVRMFYCVFSNCSRTQQDCVESF